MNVGGAYKNNVPLFYMGGFSVDAMLGIAVQHYEKLGVVVAVLGEAFCLAVYYTVGDAGAHIHESFSTQNFNTDRKYPLFEKNITILSL